MLTKFAIHFTARRNECKHRIRYCDSVCLSVCLSVTFVIFVKPAERWALILERKLPSASVTSFYKGVRVFSKIRICQWLCQYWIYIAHYHESSLMRSVHWYLANRTVFKLRLKLLLQCDGSRRLSGNEFQAIGRQTEKARRPNVFRRKRGTVRKWRLAYRKCCRQLLMLLF